MLPPSESVELERSEYFPALMMAFESPRLARGANLSTEELATSLRLFLHSITKTSTNSTGFQTICAGANQENAGRIMVNSNTEDVDPREQTRS